ncbi:hypothetical protein OC861_006418, partial [Tilletia horrida]
MFEYAEQGFLADHMAAGRIPTPKVAAWALGQLSDALDFLHHFGQRTGMHTYPTAIHRDVKLL